MLAPRGPAALLITEFLAGTHPNDPASALRLDFADATGDGIAFEFHAMSNRSYSVLHAEILGAGEWKKWMDVPAHATNRIVRLPALPAAEGHRYLRLVTPAQP